MCSTSILLSQSCQQGRSNEFIGCGEISDNLQRYPKLCSIMFYLFIVAKLYSTSDSRLGTVVLEREFSAERMNNSRLFQNAKTQLGSRSGNFRKGSSWIVHLGKGDAIKQLLNFLLPALFNVKISTD